MDTKLQERGGKILEKDGLLYNCAFSICDLGKGRNEYDSDKPFKIFVVF